MANDKDLGRANAVYGWTNSYPHPTMREKLAAEFAAVRAEERAAIVAWLRGMTAFEPGAGEVRDRRLYIRGMALDKLADAIERGDHTPAQGEPAKGEPMCQECGCPESLHDDSECLRPGCAANCGNNSR